MAADGIFVGLFAPWKKGTKYSHHERRGVQRRGAGEGKKCTGRESGGLTRPDAGVQKQRRREGAATEIKYTHCLRGEELRCSLKGKSLGKSFLEMFVGGRFPHLVENLGFPEGGEEGAGTVGQDNLPAVRIKKRKLGICNTKGGVGVSTQFFWREKE